jgi:rhamnosyltransferase
MNRLTAIIVCFHPEHEKLGSLIQALAPSVASVIVFDNGGLDVARLPAVGTAVHVESRGGVNLGIATALNICCRLAWENGARYAITFDQDSLPEPGMVETLMAELQDWQTRGQRVAAIGPRFVDVRSGVERVIPFLWTTAFAIRYLAGEETQPVSLLMTSGCLLDLQVWKLVSFDDRLFIDLVDYNWCWRLARQGYIFLGSGRARLRHELSQRLVHIGRIMLTSYTPQRRYYQCRSAVYNFLYVDVPPGGKRFLLSYLFGAWLVAVSIDAAKLRSLWQCLRGCAHGLVGRLGPS